MMYPSSAVDYSCRYDTETGHCVYNAPFGIDDTEEEIALAFKRFIDSFESGNDFNVQIDSVNFSLDIQVPNKSN